jgi:hypothetical protein
VGEPLSISELNYAGAGLFVLGLAGTWWYFVRKQPSAEPAANEPRPQ